MNPNLNATLTAIRALLMAIGGVLLDKGMGSTAAYFWIETVAGSIFVLGPAIWGVYSSIVNWRKASAVGVQAGINLTVAGKALAEDGKTVVSQNNGSTPPMPVTIATASEIVKDFAPIAPIAAK